jgi:hypothetical protein
MCPSCQATKSHFQVDSAPDDLVEHDADPPVEDDEPPSDGAVSSSAGDQSEILKPRRVYTDTSDPSVSSLKELKDEGDLNTRPPYQRYEVWPPAKKSKLIESVLLGLPVPRFYFAENQDEKQEVIDGQQRLAALFRFMDDEYALSGLKTLTEFNKKKWSGLDK